MTKTIEHPGIIVSLASHKAQVMIEQTTACGGCHAKSVCGASERKDHLIDATITDSTLKVGDHVVVCGAQSIGLKSVFWAFILPFLLILVTISLLVYYGYNETASGLIGLGILVPYYVILWLTRDRFKRKFQFYARRA